MNSSASFYVGLMSGTSLDSVDAVITSFTPKFELIATHSKAIPDTLRNKILQLMQPGNNEIDLMGDVDLELGKLFATATQEILEANDISIDKVIAIGSHGQTIRHRPELNFTLQIGSPSTIAELTQITTVADFRSRDMAAGGEGAPLVPAFHEALFKSSEKNRCLVNIGGMANITILPKETNEATLGFDTGPGNILLDSWIQHCEGKNYDEVGAWAASGSVNLELLNEMLKLPYFALPPPKSTGRELFHFEWLNSLVQKITPSIPAADIQRTLVELTATTIAREVSQHASETDELYVCGGGSHNTLLLNTLAEKLPSMHVETTGSLGLNPDWVEAAAFAWLAKQCLEGKNGSLASVTGATGDRVLGAIYPA